MLIKQGSTLIKQWYT